MRDTYMDDHGVECCDNCEAYVEECACVCVECEEYADDCSCDGGPALVASGVFY